MSGTDLKDRLFEESRISLEMADASNVVAVITFANEEKDIERLAEAVKKALTELHGAERAAGFTDGKAISRPGLFALPASAEMKMLPRDAYFAEGESVHIREAKGRISRGVICPYPPGVPYVNPGESITDDIINRLLYCLEQGIPVHGIADDGTIEVVTENNR